MTTGASTAPAQAGPEGERLAASPSPLAGLGVYAKGRGEGGSRRPTGAITIRLAKDEADAEAMIELGRRFHDEGPFFRSHPYQPERLRQIGALGLARKNGVRGKTGSEEKRGEEKRGQSRFIDSLRR